MAGVRRTRRILRSRQYKIKIQRPDFKTALPLQTKRNSRTSRLRPTDFQVALVHKDLRFLLPTLSPLAQAPSVVPVHNRLPLRRCSTLDSIRQTSPRRALCHLTCMRLAPPRHRDSRHKRFQLTLEAPPLRPCPLFTLTTAPLRPPTIRPPLTHNRLLSLTRGRSCLRPQDRK